MSFNLVFQLGKLPFKCCCQIPSVFLKSSGKCLAGAVQCFSKILFVRFQRFLKLLLRVLKGNANTEGDEKLAFVVSEFGKQMLLYLTKLSPSRSKGNVGFI